MSLRPFLLQFHPLWGFLLMTANKLTCRYGTQWMSTYIKNVVVRKFFQFPAFAEGGIQ